MNGNTTIKTVLIGMLALMVLATGPALVAAATADFTVTPDDPYVGEDVEFDASNSTASSNATYDWDFDGDGTTDATGEVVTHNFSEAGDHNVTLVVDDPDDGTSDNVTKVVSVHEKKSFEIEATDNETGNASALQVVVDGDSQDHDLIDNGSFATTLAEGTVVTFEYVDSDGNVTDTADYEVGTGGVTALAVSDATVDVTETEADTGGGGTTDGDFWETLKKHIAIEFIVFIIFGVILARWRGGK